MSDLDLQKLLALTENNSTLAGITKELKAKLNQVVTTIENSDVANVVENFAAVSELVATDLVKPEVEKVIEPIVTKVEEVQLAIINDVDKVEGAE